MWLFNSSIGKKFIMALTGAALVLFVTFHVLMNAVAIIWPGAYNAVCQFLGANWYALIASAGLGLLVVIHIIYALILTIQNRNARGNDRYAVTSRPKSVEWSSKNMFVLGIVVLAFLSVHLIQFWARMQLDEILGSTYAANGVEVPGAAGTIYLQLAFGKCWTLPVYLIGFVALWFHMTHGFWSMWQTIGWDNDTWMPRLKCIGNWWVTIVCGLFAVQAVVFTVRANQNFYINNPELRSQYWEMYNEHLEKVNAPLAEEAMSIQVEMMKAQENNGSDFTNIMGLSQRLQELRTQMNTNAEEMQKQFLNLDKLAKTSSCAAGACEANENPLEPTAAEAEVAEEGIAED